MNRILKREGGTAIWVLRPGIPEFSVGRRNGCWILDCEDGGHIIRLYDHMWPVSLEAGDEALPKLVEVTTVTSMNLMLDPNGNPRMRGTTEDAIMYTLEAEEKIYKEMGFKTAKDAGKYFLKGKMQGLVWLVSWMPRAKS